MTSQRIRFTRQPQKCTAIGTQFFWKAIDLGGDLRVLDLQLTVFALTDGESVTVKVLTSNQNDTDDDWATLGGFSKVGEPDATRHAVMDGALRYVRFNVTVLSGGSCYFLIDGEARTTL